MTFYQAVVNNNGKSMENPATIGIPSIAKQNLANGATTELPAIIMGAAVNYEVRTGPAEFTPMDNAELLPPYSYFRWGLWKSRPKSLTARHLCIRSSAEFVMAYHRKFDKIEKAIKEARTSAGLTQAALADKIKTLTASDISKAVAALLLKGEDQADSVLAGIFGNKDTGKIVEGIIGNILGGKETTCLFI